MKIAMVSEQSSPLATIGAGAGGQNVYVAELSAALARLGHKVSVYTRRDDPGLPERLTTSQGYTVVYVPAGPPERLSGDESLRHMGPFAQFLDRCWEFDRPVVTHAHFWTSGIATQLAARHLGLPTVQTFHAFGVTKRRHEGGGDAQLAARIRLEAMVARSATSITTASTDEAFELVRIGASRAQISVVPCGVDKDLFKPVGPAVEKKAKHRILSVGTLAPHRGFDGLVRAMPSIPNAELVIVSAPEQAPTDVNPEACRLRDLSKKLGVARRVQFFGSVAHTDMPALLRSADVVACMSRYDPSDIIPLEAMACGIPVVATAVGGVSDTVVHDVTGRLIAPKQPADIAAAINPLLRSSFLRQSLGHAGRDRVCARYSWDRVATDTARIYDKVAQSDVSRVSTG